MSRSRIEVSLSDEESRRLHILAQEASMSRADLIRWLLESAWKERSDLFEHDGEVFVEERGAG